MSNESARSGPGIALRFAELVRKLVTQESEAALAVLFGVSVTTINNWYKGTKLPRERDIEDFAALCGITMDELRSDDGAGWRVVLERVSALPHVIPTPPWLQFDPAIAERTRAHGVIVLAADAGDVTQRRGTQDVVRRNILRGVHYFYVVPGGGEHERALTRFVEELRSLTSPAGTPGTARIIRTVRNRKTVRQWKRIDHVMLFVAGDGLADIDNLPDLARLRIDEGYELLYKPGDQPHDAHAWKTLSVREINYYKELFEEWGAIGGDDERPLTASGLRLIGGPAEGRRWLRDNIEGAEYVYNILYRTEEGANARSKPYFDEIPAIMAVCMERGSYWLDLGLFGQDRFIASTYAALSQKHRTAYSAAVLTADIPVVQMTCVNFRDNRTAVMLGGAFPGAEGPRVFLGEDAGITNYFKSYFHSLYSRAARIYEYGAAVTKAEDDG